jgi:hypothetical protein
LLGLRISKQQHCKLQKETIMPAGYAASTGMESALSGNFDCGAELSDLRVIELGRGLSRPPSNIVKTGNPFILYTDISFVGTSGFPWPQVAVDVQYFIDAYGAGTDSDTGLSTGVYVGPVINSGNNTHPLEVTVNPNSLAPGIYKLAALVQVRWSTDPNNVVIMSGFIEGAPLQITA